MPYTFIKPIRKSANIKSLICRDHHWTSQAKINNNNHELECRWDFADTDFDYKKSESKWSDMITFSTRAVKEIEHAWWWWTGTSRYLIKPEIIKWVNEFTLHLNYINVRHIIMISPCFQYIKSMTTIPCPLCHVSISYVLCCWWWMTDCVNTPIKL